MDTSPVGTDRKPNMSFRYNANNEELEELFQVCDDDPPTPQCESSQSSVQSDNASPKKVDKTSSLIDRYFKSMRTEKPVEKLEDVKTLDTKVTEEFQPVVTKDVSSSPMREYLNRLSKKSNSSDSSSPELRDGNNETWKIFQDFRFKIAQAVEEIKTRSIDETKEKNVPRENSTSDSEENSANKDCDQQSVGDTDNQVSSLDSSMQNLSEVTSPLTAKAMENSVNNSDNKNPDSSDDTHKNIANSETADDTKELIYENSMDVESGVEALEDTIDAFSDIIDPDAIVTPIPSEPIKPPSIPKIFSLPQSIIKKHIYKPYNFLNFSIIFFTFLVLVNYIFFPDFPIWNGFVFGIWFYSFLSNVKSWVLDRYFSDREPDNDNGYQTKRTSFSVNTYTIPSVKEHRPLKKYEGWINHYRFPNYDPSTYHINKTTTAFIKLEGCNLRLSYSKTKIPRRALWDEKIDQVAFYQHRFYNLTGARMLLLPKGLVRRRQWSKKYPICIILNEKEVIQVLERENILTERRVSDDKKSNNSSGIPVQHEVETSETNTSPEKKKKFVWRKREKSITSHSDIETSKEGLRHRIVRKMHREKRDSVVNEPTESPSVIQEKSDLQESTISFPSESEFFKIPFMQPKEDTIEEELDENELSKIKDILEESELEAGNDGALDEWSMHTKQSKDHSFLYIFARTSRDKYDWYRRFKNAVHEANSGDSSISDEKLPFDPTMEPRESIDTSTVSFAKVTSKTDSLTEGVTILSATMFQSDEQFYEKNFWNYFYKIVQSKTSSSTNDQSHSLPAEVTWLNSMLARLFYDVMRDQRVTTRLQHKIQKKLDTLKLPSFMSPLLVTDLSLVGACPLVEHVTPTWDERGVWLDADMRYTGGAYISIQTQINLMKLKQKNLFDEQLMETSLNEIEPEMEGTTSKTDISETQLRRSKPAIFDSDVEDSAESSTDDEETPYVQPVDSVDDVPLADVSQTSTEGGTSSKKKFLRIVDKIATNKYFQQVTDYKYVKRAMEGLSNTDIKLQVEVQGFDGRLAINFPPPPHDRLWLGFRTNPHLVLKARPAVGTRSVRITHVTNWIEQKLIKEFEKVLVLPNMEDIVIDFMTPTPVDFE